MHIRRQKQTYSITSSARASRVGGTSRLNGSAKFWLGELANVSLGHGVSLTPSVEKWELRTPPRDVTLPFMRSATFARSSGRTHMTAKTKTMMEGAAMSPKPWVIGALVRQLFSIAGPQG